MSRSVHTIPSWKARLVSSFWSRLLLPTGIAVVSFFIPTKEASAQPVKGLYVDGAAGATFNQGQEVERHGKKNGKELFDPGYMGKAAIGWGLGNGFRVEVEGNYRQNKLDRFIHMNSGPNAISASGHQRQFGAMANALFDMDIGQNWVYPYFGAGIGYGWQQMDAYARQKGTNHHISGTSGGFAYQGIFGLSFPIPWVVGLSTTLEYRFYTTTGRHRHSLSDGSLVTGTASPDGAVSGRFSTRTNFNHSLMWGLRYQFNAQPPQDYLRNTSALATLAPASVKEKSYLVFFDTNSATVTPKAQDILEVAARDSSHTQLTNIEIRDSNNAHDKKLSDKRVKAVQAALVRNGIPASQIGVNGTNAEGQSDSKDQVFKGHHVEITIH